MIGIGEDELGLQFMQVARFQRFDVGLGADGCKDGRWDCPVGRVKRSQARVATGFVQFKAERRRGWLGFGQMVVC